MLYSTLV